MSRGSNPPIGYGYNKSYLALGFDRFPSKNLSVTLALYLKTDRPALGCMSRGSNPPIGLACLQQAIPTVRGISGGEFQAFSPKMLSRQNLPSVCGAESTREFLVISMITEEMLTLPAVTYSNGGAPRKPVEGFTEMVNGVLMSTGTEFKEWSFHGQENTQIVKQGYFFGLYIGPLWSGFGFRFCMRTGSFIIDARQCLETDAKGFQWWFLNGYPKEEGTVAVRNPELIKKGKPSPRRGDSLSSTAKKSLRDLLELSSPPRG